MPNTKIHNKNLNNNAKHLRKNQTAEERKLWYTFLKTLPSKFKRQVSIGNYIADFYCSKANLAIEIDGSQHFEEDAIAYDNARDTYFNGLGITVLRYTNLDVNTKFKDVCNDIYNFLMRNNII